MTLPAFTAASLTRGVIDLGDSRVNALSNAVFTQANTHPTSTIYFGKMVDDPRVLVYNRKQQPSTPISKTTGSLNNIDAPILRPSSFMDEEFFSLLNAALGGYNGTFTDPMVQAAAKVAFEQSKLRKRIDKTIEKQCVEGLTSGVITIPYSIDDATDYVTISLNYTGDGATDGAALTIQKTLDGTAAWTGATSTPLDDLANLARYIRQTSDWDGALDVWMGWRAFQQFSKHKTVGDKLTTNIVQLGSLTLSEQAAYKGMINSLRIFEYQGGYMSGTTPTDLWDKDTVCVIPRGGDYFSREYGAVFENQTPGASPRYIQTEYFSKFCIEENPPSQELIVECRPIALVRNPRVIRVLKTAAA